MIYKILITLKDSGKVIEIFVEQTEDNKIFEISQTMSHIEWLIIKGFDTHPLKVNKTVGVRWKEIAGIEIMQADNWFAESGEKFHHSLNEKKDENKS